VSWNGATDVAFWELQGQTNDDGGSDEWQSVDVLEKEAFEESFVLPSGDTSFPQYRVAALDNEHGFMRYSNIATPPPADAASYLLAAISALACICAVVGFWFTRKRGWVPDWRKYAQYAVDRSKYQKLR